ncbi:MAG: phenylalanine 4-monooxygenase [Oceanicaulis sp.]|uniref:phenylalanine 4-monooxygenase n=1 Tax=Oceanicaulis TaxID=153232 RepID=UPI000C092BA2|nr:MULTISPECIES: phenylalanine 4-monooxygenase [Oceanicaulis]MAP48848.1 phenylalanine 4-monooxygenase [Oceanicaulis sp.]
MLDEVSTSIPDMGRAYYDPLVQDSGNGLTGPGGALHRYAIRPEGYRLGDEDFISESWQLKRQPDYTPAEHARWRLLFENQRKMLPGRACKDFMEGFEQLEHLFKDGIPSFDDINAILKPATGWTVVPVPELIPDNIFFWHLENRRFPAGVFIRGGNPKTKKVKDANQGRAPEFVEYTAVEDDLFYLQEPDTFHDIFGHVPMLMNPFFADYIQAYGAGGRRAIEYNRLKNFGSVYWYTVEFGLIMEEGELRVYGAGILSSPDETLFSLYSDSPHRIKMVPERVMRTDYVISDFQETYFVVDSIKALYESTAGRDFTPIYKKLPAGFTYATTAALDTDVIVTEGTQEYKFCGGKGKPRAAAHMEAIREAHKR